MSLETNVPQINQNIPTDGQHGTVLTYISQLALSQPKPEDMFSTVTTLLAEILPAGLILLWELDADREDLVLRNSAGSGGKDGAVIESYLPLELNSLEELVLQSPYPIVVYELKTDARFRSPQFLQDFGAISGLAVTVGTVQSPHAILEAFSRHHQDFSQHDVHFFHSVANILGLFIETNRYRAIWPTPEQGPEKKSPSIPKPNRMELDQDEVKSRLLESRERERLRLAQELHDIPIQDLYGLMYQLEDLKDVVRDTESMEILEEFNSTIHRVVNNLRTMCGELRPPSLSPFGLEVAIRDHVEKLRHIHPDLQIHLDLMRDQQTLSDSIRLCLFRNYQQAVANVIRHAQATEVQIRFRWDDQLVVLEVEDNGIGFEMPDHWVELVRQEKFGLIGIAERVESVQGNLEIVTTPGSGTLIRIRVPRR